MQTTPYPGSTTDHAAQIRAALKAAGWSSRDVSVRAEYYSMGSSIHVTIKNPRVWFRAVERIANAHEDISRDGNGEILSGGNRFVDVRYSTSAREALAAPYRDTLQAAEQELQQASQNALIPIANTGFFLGRGYAGGVSLWGQNTHVVDAYHAVDLAAELAIRIYQAVH